MAARVNVEKRPRHPPVAIEDEGRTIGDACREDAKGAGELAALIGEQRERESMLVGKRAMRRRRIGADADHGAVERAEFLVQVAKFLALKGASGRVVLGIEIERDGLPDGNRSAGAYGRTGR